MDIQETLKGFILQNLVADSHKLTLSEDDNLLTGGLVDSLGVMRLINFIEENFKVQVPPEDVTLENFRTIRVMAGYLQQRMDALSVK